MQSPPRPALPRLGWAGAARMIAAATQSRLWFLHPNYSLRKGYLLRRQDNRGEARRGVASPKRGLRRGRTASALRSSNLRLCAMTYEGSRVSTSRPLASLLGYAAGLAEQVAGVQHAALLSHKKDDISMQLWPLFSETLATLTRWL